MLVSSPGPFPDEDPFPLPDPGIAGELGNVQGPDGGESPLGARIPRESGSGTRGLPERMGTSPVKVALGPKKRTGIPRPIPYLLSISAIATAFSVWP